MFGQFDFISWVIKGSLIDRTEKGDEIRKRWSIKYIPAEHKHKAVIREEAITLILAFRKRRIWGYWRKGRFFRRNGYFARFGHHNPCYYD